MRINLAIICLALVLFFIGYSNIDNYASKLGELATPNSEKFLLTPWAPIALPITVEPAQIGVTKKPIYKKPKNCYKFQFETVCQ